MNLIIKESVKSSKQLLNAKTWPEKFTCSFLEPGLVSYENEGLGKCYLDKPALDKLCPTFVGKPIVNAEDHVDGMRPEDLDRVAKGYISNVYWKDGWYYADCIVFDDKTKADMKSGKYSVSCAYEVTSADDKGGIKNNINYEQEVLDGVGTHIAVVKNPRYGQAKILLNSIGGNMNKMIKGWFKSLLNKSAKNEISPEDIVDVDGEKVSIGDLQESVEDEQAEEVAKAAEPKEQEINPDSVIQIGDKSVTLQNAINIYKKRNKKNVNDTGKEAFAQQEYKKSYDDLTPEERAKVDKIVDKIRAEKKNAGDAAAKKAEEDKKNAEEAEAKNKEEDKKNAEAKEAKEKEEADKKKKEELQNASAEAVYGKPYAELTNEEKTEADKYIGKDMDETKKNAEEAKEKIEKDKENSRKNSQHFLKLKNSAEQRVALNGPTVQVVEDKRAKGKACYGPK